MIVLTILKIIGIVIVSILALVLVLALLILFFPVTYRVNLVKDDEDVNAVAAAKWLFGAVSAKAAYTKDGLKYRLGVFGAAVFSSDNNRGAGETKGKNFPRRGKENTNENSEADINAPEADMRTQAIKADRKNNAAGNKNSEDERIEKHGKTLREKLSLFAEKLRNVYKKFLKLKEKARTAKYIVSAPVSKRAAHTLKLNLFKILNHIKPRKVKGRVEYGCADPADCALRYGAMSMAASLAGGDLLIVPNMDEEKLLLDVSIKGGFFIGFMLLCVLRVLFNKDVKRTARYIKKHLLG